MPVFVSVEKIYYFLMYEMMSFPYYIGRCLAAERILYANSPSKLMSLCEGKQQSKVCLENSVLIKLQLLPGTWDMITSKV